MQNGVVLHTGSSSTGNSSYMLDATPGTSSFQRWCTRRRQQLHRCIGQRHNHAADGRLERRRGIDYAGGGRQCTRQSPTVTLGPASASGSAGYRGDVQRVDDEP